MARFDKTEQSYVKNKAEDLSTQPQIGEVVKVTEHVPDEEVLSNVEVDVTLRGEQKPRNNVPVLGSSGSMMEVPEVGDLVLIGFRESTTTSPIVFGKIYNTKQRAPFATENMTRYKKGDLYFEFQSGLDEAEKPAEWIRMAKKAADDKYDGLAATIEIDDTEGKDTIIKIKGQDEVSEMGLELNLATGEFKLGDGSGYGIVSDGSGNITIYGNSVSKVEDGTKISW
jgi:hypothetical protein